MITFCLYFDLETIIIYERWSKRLTFINTFIIINKTLLIYQIELKALILHYLQK